MTFPALDLASTRYGEDGSVGTSNVVEPALLSASRLYDSPPGSVTVTVPALEEARNDAGGSTAVTDTLPALDVISASSDERPVTVTPPANAREAAAR